MKLLSTAYYENLRIEQAQLRARLAWYEEQMAALRATCAKWEKLWEHANARAERAIDAQLAVRGFPQVTPRDGMPEMPDELAEDPEKVAAIETRLLRGDASVFTERF